MAASTILTPQFSRPPIIELALGIQFRPLKSFGSVQAFSWRERIKNLFPTVNECPELPDIVEKFEPEPTKVQIELVHGVSPIRYWFISEDDKELIQLQRNRFIYNWRKRKDGDQYPSYATLRSKFESQYRLFLDFCSSEKMGDVIPMLGEVTYVDHISPTEIWQHHGEAHKVFCSLSAQQTGDFLPPTESLNLTATYRIPSDTNITAPKGRLHIRAESRFLAADKSPIFRLSICARTFISDQSVAGTLDALDVGHIWATSGFAAATTPEMHKAWGRTR